MIPGEECSMKLTVRENPGSLEKCLRALGRLKKARVKVGLPPSAGGRLLFILAVQEHGSPVMRIPARPVIRPALSDPSVRAEMAGHFRSAIGSAWEGNEAAARAALEAAGQAGADGIRRYIDAGISPPNSPVTVSGGWIWNRPGKKGVHIKGKGFNKPLYDTGALYEAFGYEVERRDGLQWH